MAAPPGYVRAAFRWVPEGSAADRAVATADQLRRSELRLADHPGAAGL